MTQPQLEAYLHSIDNFTGLLCLALLQILQVISVVLPGAPIQIAGGIVYGTWPSFFICHLSSVAANVIVFMAARRLGKKLDEFMPAEKKSITTGLSAEIPKPGIYDGCRVPRARSSQRLYSIRRRQNKNQERFILQSPSTSAALLPVLILCAVGSKILKGGYVASAILLISLFILVFVLAIYKNKILGLINKLSARYR